MNSIRLLIGVLLLTVACHAAPPPGLPPSPPQPALAKEAVNYTIRVEWKNAKKDPSSLQLVTSEGSFELNSLAGTTKINDSDVPSTVRLTGTITEMSPEKGRVQLFLGRTVPYVTGTVKADGGKSSSYSQMSVGLQSTFIVTFGKPLVVQTDDNGTVTILVKRGED